MAGRNMEPQKNPMPVQPPEERRRNFSEVALGYTPEQAASEAARCLHCKNKPCVEGCPVRIDIPAFLERAAEQDFSGAYAVILTVCPRPFFLAVTIPLLFTVAHFFFEELHFTFLFVAFEGEINTLSFRFLPAFRAVLEACIFIFFILIFFLFVTEVELFCSDVTKEGGIMDELAGGI